MDFFAKKEEKIIKKIAILQAKAFNISHDINGLDSVEKTLIIIAGVLLAAFLVTIMTIYITGNGADSIKTKSQTNVSEVFNVD